MNILEDGIHNAIIQSANIVFDDCGFLTIWLTLDYYRCGQNFGGFVLHKLENDNCLCDYTGIFVTNVMEIAEIKNWKDIQGKSIRVSVKNGFAIGIGHIIKNLWFYPERKFREYKNATWKNPNIHAGSVPHVRFFYGEGAI